jgi:hypothetical protein
MPTLDDDTLLIPFGTSKWSDRRLNIGDDGSFQCLAPHVLVGKSEREALRLNSAQYEFMEPPNHRELADPTDQLEFVLNHMKIHCDLWGKLQKLFLDRYVQFIAAHVEENKAELGELIKPYGSLYQYCDWMFSAYRPLPQAHLNVVGGMYTPEDLIAVDFVFWGLEGGIALYLISSPHRNSARQRRYDRLEDAGITVVEIEHSCLQPDQQATFEDQLPDIFRAFWKDEPFPSGPFKSNVLGDADIDL